MIALERTGLQQNIRNSLVSSSLVPVYLSAMKSVPGSAIFSPTLDDFWDALRFLELEMDIVETNAQ